MNVLSIVPPNSTLQRAETDAAWHIYCALVRYRKDNPEMMNNSGYSKAVLEAHDRYSALFGGVR